MDKMDNKTQTAKYDRMIELLIQGALSGNYKENELYEM